MTRVVLDTPGAPVVVVNTRGGPVSRLIRYGKSRRSPVAPSGVVLLEDVPVAPSSEDARALDLDTLFLGFNVRDKEGHRIDPMTVRRRQATTSAVLGLPFEIRNEDKMHLFWPDPLSFIGSAANEGA